MGVMIESHINEGKSTSDRLAQHTYTYFR
jgi:3-deoxy-D-arabino-heptulosonate 7-phosphate (DAHP) synthase